MNVRITIDNPDNPLCCIYKNVSRLCAHFILRHYWLVSIVVFLFHRVMAEPPPAQLPLQVRAQEVLANFQEAPQPCSTRSSNCSCCSREYGVLAMTTATAGNTPCKKRIYSGASAREARQRSTMGKKNW